MGKACVSYQQLTWTLGFDYILQIGRIGTGLYSHWIMPGIYHHYWMEIGRTKTGYLSYRVSLSTINSLQGYNIQCISNISTPPTYSLLFRADGPKKCVSKALTSFFKLYSPQDYKMLHNIYTPNSAVMEVCNDWRIL